MNDRLRASGTPGCVSDAAIKADIPIWNSLSYCYTEFTWGAVDDDSDSFAPLRAVSGLWRNFNFSFAPARISGIDTSQNFDDQSVPLPFVRFAAFSFAVLAELLAVLFRY
jgi:hypothetical protein